MPKKKSRLKTVLIVIAVIIAIGIIGNLLPNEDSGEVSTNNNHSTTATKPPKATLAPTEIPYIKITSTELIAAYKDNQVKCKQLYDKKLLEVTGTVESIGTDILDQTYVCLGSDTEITFIGIQCYAKNDDEINKIADLKEGDVITVRGKGDCGSLSFSLEKAEIVQ